MSSHSQIISHVVAISLGKAEDSDLMCCIGSPGTSERLPAGSATGRWCSCHHPKARVLQRYSFLFGIAKYPQPFKSLPFQFTRILNLWLHGTDRYANCIGAACRFVVKATDTSGRKLFLNMCTSEHVVAPASWQGHQVEPLSDFSLVQSAATVT